MINDDKDCKCPKPGFDLSPAVPIGLPPVAPAEPSISDVIGALTDLSADLTAEADQTQAAIDSLKELEQAENDQTQAAIANMQLAFDAKLEALTQLEQAESDQTQTALENLQNKIQAESDETQNVINLLEQSGDENTTTLVTTLTALQQSNSDASAMLKAAIEAIEDLDDTDDDVKVDVLLSNACVFNSEGLPTGKRAYVVTKIKSDELGNEISRTKEYLDSDHNTLVLAAGESIGDCTSKSIVTGYVECDNEQGWYAEYFPVTEAVNIDDAYVFPWGDVANLQPTGLNNPQYNKTLQDGTVISITTFLRDTRFNTNAGASGTALSVYGAEVFGMKGFIKVPVGGAHIRAYSVNYTTNTIRLSIGENKQYGYFDSTQNPKSYSDVKFYKEGVYPIELIGWDSAGLSSLALEYSTDGTNFNPAPSDWMRLNDVKFKTQKMIVYGNGLIADINNNLLSGALLDLPCWYDTCSCDSGDVCIEVDMTGVTNG